MMIAWPRLILSFLLLLSLGAGASPASSTLTTRPEVGETLFLPLNARAAAINSQESVVITAFVPDGLVRNEIDEAIALENTGQNPAHLKGYRLSDGEGTTVLPNIILAPGELAWCARQASAFQEKWGFAPACEYEKDTDAAVPDAVGNFPRLSNQGDEIQLLTPTGLLMDAVVYGAGDETTVGWQGGAVPYYRPSNMFPPAGQVFYRLFDAASQKSWPDTNQTADWAQGNQNPRWGRRVAYEGWQWREFAASKHFTWRTPPSAQLAVGPDALLEFVEQSLAQARTSIWLEIYELTHPQVVQTLANQAQKGLDVRILLEGAPAGGLSDAERWAAQTISLAGGQVFFMVNDVGTAADRYPFLHAKFAIIDGQTLLLSTENFKTEALPAVTETGWTSGHRGYVLALQDRQIAAAAMTIFLADSDTTMSDIFPWTATHEQYGAPPAGYQPPPIVPTADYFLQYPDPIPTSDTSEAILFTSPESSLSPGPLLDLIDRAGRGDTILIQQLYEQPYWGASDSSPSADPNPRLEALLAAARRGAKVRLLLDSFFDRATNPRSNAATKAYVAAIAGQEGLDIEVRRGSPSGRGIHAKIHLLALGNERWLVISSINGSETSSKLNREIGLALQSSQAFAGLQRVFWDDWSKAGEQGEWQ